MSKMASIIPDEIDVFTVPHSRMKQLVNIYTHKMSCVDFGDVTEMMSLLRGLGSTLHEFKSHESIENIFIMDELKNRLKQHKIYNTAVCECHADNRLSHVLQVMKTGIMNRQSVMERQKFGIRLQEAFHEFVSNFIPHMEEEEQVFQPLLVEHFEYEELKILKEVVLKEHETVQELGQEKGQREQLNQGEVCEDLKDLRDLDYLHLNEAEEREASQKESEARQEESEERREELEREARRKEEQERREEESEAKQEVYIEHTERTQSPEHTNIFQEHTERTQKEQNYFEHTERTQNYFEAHTNIFQAPILPPEILIKIFQYLEIRDLCICAKVSRSWNRAVYTPSLWHSLFPVQWARGIWGRENVKLGDRLEDQARLRVVKFDEDADDDEFEATPDPVVDREAWVFASLISLLPKVGTGVRTLVVEAGRGISSRALQNALVLCPNLRSLSAGYTLIDCYAFKRLGVVGALGRLIELDLQGCHRVDDSALTYLALCGATKRLRRCGVEKGKRKYVRDGSYSRPNMHAPNSHRDSRSPSLYPNSRSHNSHPGSNFSQYNSYPNSYSHYNDLLSPNSYAPYSNSLSHNSHPNSYPSSHNSYPNSNFSHNSYPNSNIPHYNSYPNSRAPNSNFSHPNSHLSQYNSYPSSNVSHYNSHSSTYSHSPSSHPNSHPSSNFSQYKSYSNPRALNSHPNSHSSNSHPNSDLSHPNSKCWRANCDCKNCNCFSNSVFDIENETAQLRNETNSKQQFNSRNYLQVGNEAMNFGFEIDNLENETAQLENETDNLKNEINETAMNFGFKTDQHCFKTAQLENETDGHCFETDNLENKPAQHRNEMNFGFETDQHCFKPRMKLRTLNLSGCYQITDIGLGSLASTGSVSELTTLDLSGCYRLSGRGLSALAESSQSLRPESLWYCDNIEDGPWPMHANGCANLDNPIKACCRNGQ